MCLMFLKEGIVRKLKKVLPVLLLVFGLIFAGASFYGYRLLLSNEDNAEQMTHQIQSKKASQQRTKDKNEMANFNPDQIKPVSPSEYAAAQLKYEEIVNQWGIGSLYIPSANIQSKILAGMANENLMVATGTYYPDQKQGKGNYVLLAHNLVEGGGALGTLPSTRLGHIIYTTDFSIVYEYIASKNSTVDQTEGNLLEVPSDKETPLITLFRCEGGLNTPSRALVQGKFNKSYPAHLATEDVKIGLGLGVMKEVTSDTTDKDKEVSQSKDQNKKVKSDEFKQEKPKYSLIEKIAIACFSIINQYPILLSLGFIGLLLVLIRFSK